MTTEKTLDNASVEQVKANVPDVKIVGNGDLFRVLCKASSKNEGWMKSTKVMVIPGVGAVLNISTQQRNPDGSYAVAEAAVFVPGVEALDLNTSDGRLVAAKA